MAGTGSDVMFVRWPAETDLRNRCKRDGVPRLLVVEAGARPPVCNDPFEDWVRAPIARADLDARVRALQNRLDHRQTPTLDSAGTLTFGPHSITVSNVQTELMELFIEHYGEVVYRHELTQRLAERVQRPTRNSLDLHIMRLRRRLLPTDLVIKTAWGRGYVLETEVG
ncbi:Response regulators consisting of a CheY-like receiver domain and a winged-helix DNA-binding domain [Streptomyces sp. Ncost-T6T-1]|uniref:winged helix-turn-helix domain-containing protein n=1 Tax=Streptomyces sp. Ncost-T6T-1 TaxID=1100828 RepID=UPI0008059051|nr:winged helix-turn-helix domain-containing protein [Streptomyces sp. Ncost-T6T-1]SBU91129.1 Response regulators consisting of a CheY-like receiver domain and a winged-helix DNA-binding domain [Streptomyces sp. Ncost-T6T-1]